MGRLQDRSCEGVMYHLDFESLGQPLCKAGDYDLPRKVGDRLRVFLGFPSKND